MQFHLTAAGILDSGFFHFDLLILFYSGQLQYKNTFSQITGRGLYSHINWKEYDCHKVTKFQFPSQVTVFIPLIFHKMVIIL